MTSTAYVHPFNAIYPTQEEITRNKLLDAGIVCIDRYGIKKTNMRLIAEQSGIARQTVYNYFSSKNELLSAAFFREGVKLGEAAARYVEQFNAAGDKLVEGFLFIHDNFPRNPILAKVIDPGIDFFGTVGLRNYPFAMFGDLVFAQVFADHPYLRPDAESICELWIRNVMSLLTMPGPAVKTPDDIRKYVRERLLPGVGVKE